MPDMVLHPATAKAAKTISVVSSFILFSIFWSGGPAFTMLPVAEGRTS